MPVPHRPQSSSASRFTAGASGFLSQSGGRSVGRILSLRYYPFEAELAGLPNSRAWIDDCPSGRGLSFRERTLAATQCEAQEMRQ
jgi:hypothetical protein